MSNESAGSERVKRGIADILGELEDLFSKDQIGAVQVNIVRRDGSVRTCWVYDHGFRVLIVGAAAIGARQVIEDSEVVKEESWRAPSPPSDG